MMTKIVGVITIVKDSEDISHGDDGKWFSDLKIILRTRKVILPVKMMILNGKIIDTDRQIQPFSQANIKFLSSIFYFSLRLNNDTSPEEKARAISLGKERCYRSASLVMFIRFQTSVQGSFGCFPLHVTKSARYEQQQFQSFVTMQSRV